MIKNRAFVQEAQQDKTSYSQARLQRGQTEGRNYALYTRDTSSQHQQTQCWPVTKAVLTFPVVFRKTLWHTSHFNKKCLIYITLSFMQLSTLWCWRPDKGYEKYTGYTNGPIRITDIHNICTDSPLTQCNHTVKRGLRLRLRACLYCSHSHTFSAIWKLAAVASSNN